MRVPTGVPCIELTEAQKGKQEIENAPKVSADRVYVNLSSSYDKDLKWESEMSNTLSFQYYELISSLPLSQVEISSSETYVLVSHD